MTTGEQVREICRKLPGAIAGEGTLGFGVMKKGKVKGFCWCWMERHDPKKARVPNERVLAVRTPGLVAKDLLLESDPDCLFTEPHYNGYPAVLVRLDMIAPKDLEPLLVEAWRCTAPKSEVKVFDAGNT